MTTPSRSRPIEMAKCGIPCRKLVVPSSGSTTQRWLLSAPSRTPPSSPRKPYPGRALISSWNSDLLGAAVGCGDEIRRALHRHLEFLQLAEITLEGARGFARGRDHHIERGGVGHLRVLSSAEGRGRGMPAPARAVKAAAQSRSRAISARRLRRRRARFGCLAAKTSRSGSLSPAALAMRCHLIASVGLAGVPRPAIKMRASRFCAMALPRFAALRKRSAATNSFCPCRCR